LPFRARFIEDLLFCGFRVMSVPALNASASAFLTDRLIIDGIVDAVHRCPASR
jgi:hypothetical protein